MNVETVNLVKTVKPLHDRVLIKRDDAAHVSKGGIVIPNQQEKPVEGTVVAVGPGKRSDSGELQAMTIKTGDKVLFGKYAGTEIKLDSEEYVIMREDDIMAIMQD